MENINEKVLTELGFAGNDIGGYEKGMIEVKIKSDGLFSINFIFGGFDEDGQAVKVIQPWKLFRVLTKGKLMQFDLLLNATT